MVARGSFHLLGHHQATRKVWELLPGSCQGSIQGQEAIGKYLMVTSGPKAGVQEELPLTTLNAAWEPAGLVEPALAVATTVLSPDIWQHTHGAVHVRLGG